VAIAASKSTHQRAFRHWPATGHPVRRHAMDKTELAKIEAFFRRTFANASIRVVPLGRKKDSAEVYVGEDFLGVVSLDEDEGERSYAFNMAILDVDLED
jgi:hypothetical protein